MTARKRPAKKKCASCGKSFTPNSNRQKFCEPNCPRKQRAKSSAAKTAEEIIVHWATTHGSPTRLLIGWNPDEGIWQPESPMGQVLKKIRKGGHVVVSGRPWGFHDMTDLIAKGAEYAVTAAENRDYIPMEIRPFVDLYNQVAKLEAEAELQAVEDIYDRADVKEKLAFLGRRWPSRWREQQQVMTTADVDEREAAVSRVISDPANAAALATLADQIEDQIEGDERTTQQQ